MFKQILYTQWKWTGWFVVLTAIGVFAVPVMSVQAVSAWGQSRGEAAILLESLASWGHFYPIAAAAAGVVIAVAGWSADQAGNHVYALSLPLPRWHYVLLRYSAGAILLAPVVLGMWVGGLLASVSVAIPLGLHPYPTTLALRFGLAAALSYTFMFALSSGTKRTAMIGFGGVVAIFALQAVLSATGSDYNLIQGTFDTLMQWPGPFDVFGSQWMLINV